MRTLNPIPARRGGFSLVEVMLSTVLIAVILSAIGMSMVATRGSAERGLTSADVEAQAQRILEHIKAEVRCAQRASVALTPATPASRIDYQRVVMTAEPPRRVRLALMAGELDNDLDDNGNGLVDERRVELLPDPAGAPGMIVGWGNWVRELAEGELDNGIDDNGNGVVDEPGLWLTFNAVTGNLTIQVTVERSVADGTLFTSTKRAVIQLRNG